jgi:hypothetical protein
MSRMNKSSTTKFALIEFPPHHYLSNCHVDENNPIIHHVEGASSARNQKSPMEMENGQGFILGIVDRSTHVNVFDLAAAHRVRQGSKRFSYLLDP